MWQLTFLQPNVLSGSPQQELQVGVEGHRSTQEVGLLGMGGPCEAVFIALSISPFYYCLMFHGLGQLLRYL